jgi:hypothetical protein
MREANELQRQLLELRKASPTSKAASTRRQDARAVIQTSSESHRGQNRARPSAREPNASRQGGVDSQAAPAAESNAAPQPNTWSTRSAMADRLGRQ